MPILNSFSVVEVRPLIEENSSWGSHFSAAPQICRVNDLTFGFAAKLPEITVEFSIRTSRSGPTCSGAEINVHLVWRRIRRCLSRDSVISTRVGLSTHSTLRTYTARYARAEVASCERVSYVVSGRTYFESELQYATERFK